MSDNPFAEPGDADPDDRTVIRPMPGGQRAAARVPASPQPIPTQPSIPGQPSIEEPGDLAFADPTRPLAAAAAPLIQLLARLRNTAAPPDPGDIRARTIRELRQFEKRAREAGVPMEQLRPAHFALCASLDDVVLNTPWGAAGPWRAKPLVPSMHPGREGGEGFVDQLRQLRRDPAGALPVLELMYLCLSLGFMGPYRATPETLERVRTQVHNLIAGQRAPGPAALSGAWQGIAAPYRPARARVPLWVGGSVALAGVAGLFLWALTGLNDRSDALLGRMLSAAPAVMPRLVRAPLIQPQPPPGPSAPGPADRLRAALGPEPVIIGSPSAITLRIPAHLLFAAGAATLQPAAAPLLDRVGRALKAEPGPVRVIGYTDLPGRTVQFPSAFALSTARAAAVRMALVRSMGDAARLASEGRANADPIAPATTAEGREANRRIDIVLPLAP